MGDQQESSTSTSTTSTSNTAPTTTSESNLVANHYTTLGVPLSASLKDITKAYKSLVMKWHPDRNASNRKEAEDKFRNINEAYKVLSTHKKEENGSHNEKHKSRTLSGDRLSISNPTLVSSTSNRVTPTSPRSSSSVSSSGASSTTPPSIPSRGRGGASNLSNQTSKSSGIIFSQSQSKPRKKPPPVEKKLHCTLEELCRGCVRKVKITRNVVSHVGAIVQQEEILTIKVKPGWKKGTKVTFEGKGDETPGTLPADIIFVIAEKRHPLFKRGGDNLNLGVEIPLVQALTGCTLDVPLLGGENVTMRFDEIIYHGYEKVIPKEGMPKPKEKGRKGDLRLNFLVQFPKKLGDDQRSEIVGILEEAEEAEEAEVGAEVEAEPAPQEDAEEAQADEEESQEEEEVQAEAQAEDS